MQPGQCATNEKSCKDRSHYHIFLLVLRNLNNYLTTKTVRHVSILNSAHHHELAFTTRSWELQARNATDSSRCRAAPLRLLRAGLLSMVRRVSSAQPPLGKVLRCWDMVKVRGKKKTKQKNYLKIFIYLCQGQLDPCV